MVVSTVWLSTVADTVVSLPVDAPAVKVEVRGSAGECGVGGGGSPERAAAEHDAGAIGNTEPADGIGIVRKVAREG